MDTLVILILLTLLWAIVGRRLFLMYIDSDICLHYLLEYILVALSGPVIWYGVLSIYIRR